MKAQLIYDLENLDDEMALKRALKSIDMALVLFEIAYNLKKKCIWDVESHDPDDGALDEIELVFIKLNELLDEHNININELIR